MTTMVCERGLGSMPESTCASRWREANGKVAGTSAQRLLELQRTKCSGCPYGIKRAKAGAHLVQDQDAPPASVEVLPLELVRERLLTAAALRASDATPPPPAPADGHEQEVDDTTDHEEEPMRKYEPRVCEHKPCSKTYTPTSPRQRFHADECKHAASSRAKPPKGGGSKALARAPKERAAVVEPTPAPVPTHVLNGYRVHVGRLQVECATLQHLVDLVEHYGGGAEPR